MRLDVEKLDERIKKLQAIRKIADDPEMVSILLEFVLFDEKRTGTPEPEGYRNGSPEHAVEVSDLVKDILIGPEQSGPEQHASASLWGRRRD